MLDTTTASPPTTSIHAEPLTASEIDAHPDRDRIWATIEAVKRDLGEEDDWSFFEGADVE